METGKLSRSRDWNHFSTKHHAEQLLISLYSCLCVYIKFETGYPSGLVDKLCILGVGVPWSQSFASPLVRLRWGWSSGGIIAISYSRYSTLSCICVLRSDRFHHDDPVLNPEAANQKIKKSGSGKPCLGELGYNPRDGFHSQRSKTIAKHSSLGLTRVKFQALCFVGCFFTPQQYNHKVSCGYKWLSSLFILGGLRVWTCNPESF